MVVALQNNKTQRILLWLIDYGCRNRGKLIAVSAPRKKR